MHLKVESLIVKRQYGFLSNRSCAINLTILIEDITKSLHNNVGIDIIYFDFAKAFDSVSHDIILHKYKTKFNIDGRLLKFLQDYLKHRKQRVIIDNMASEVLDVYSGIQQGSILGPLLFILFINDIYNQVNPDARMNSYADDTKTWRPMHTEQDCKALKNDVNMLQQWCIDNKMKFNINKCHALTITATNYLQLLMNELPFSKFFYSLNDKIIDYTCEECDLRILVNPKFNFENDRQAIITKVYQFLGLTKRSCFFVNDKRRKRSLYLAMVRSQFEHCSVIWLPNYNTRLIASKKYKNAQ